MLISATAHPAKFCTDVLSAIQPTINATSPESSDDSSSQKLFTEIHLLSDRPRRHIHLEQSVRLPRKHHNSCAADVEHLYKEVLGFVA